MMLCSRWDRSYGHAHIHTSVTRRSCSCARPKVIVGTSTGAILAAGLQEGLSLEELEAMYLELAGEVFVKESPSRRYE